MKYRILAIGLLVFIPILSWADSCDVQVKVDLPAGVDQYHPYIKRRRGIYPISEANPTVCLTKKQAHLSPSRLATEKINVMIKKGDKTAPLLTSYVFIQSPSIYIDNVSTIASWVCGARNRMCAYYLFNKLKKRSDIIEVAHKYKQLTQGNLEQFFGLWSYRDRVEKAGTMELKVDPSLDYVDLPKTWLAQLAKFSKTRYKPLDLYIKPNLEQNQPKASFVNSHIAGDPRLQSKQLTPAEVLASWLLRAYYQPPEAQRPALFSKRFREQSGKIYQSYNLRTAVEWLIQLPYHIEMDDRNYAYRRLVAIYDGALKQQDNRIWLDDAVGVVGLIYEDGSWRLDQACRRRKKDQICEYHP